MNQIVKDQASFTDSLLAQVEEANHLDRFGLLEEGHVVGCLFSKKGCVNKCGSQCRCE